MENISNNTQKPRIAFIDLAKGVCIIMVVLFHAQVITTDFPLVGALRMPLYFFLSGMFFKSYGGILSLALKKLNKILVPFAFFYIIGELAFIAIINAFGEDIARTYHYNLLRPLLEEAPHNYPLWFLICLFWSNIIFCVLKGLLRHDVAVGVGVMACGAVGVYLSAMDITLPAWVAPALTSLPFFYMGYMMRRGPWLYEGWHDRLSLPIGLGLIAVALGLSWIGNNAHLSLAHNRIEGNAAFAYITSAVVVPGVLMVCKGIGRLPIVSYVGRYSIVVLGLHMVLMSPIRVAMRPYDPTVCNIVSGVSAILLCLAAIPLCVRYLPRFTAQADLVTWRWDSVKGTLRSILRLG